MVSGKNVHLLLIYSSGFICSQIGFGAIWVVGSDQCSGKAKAPFIHLTGVY